MMLGIGREFGLRRIRIPAEPPAVLARCGTQAGLGDQRALSLDPPAAPAGSRGRGDINDHCFGLAWSGHMTARAGPLPAGPLPEGDSEIYFHPAAGRDGVLDR